MNHISYSVDFNDQDVMYYNEIIGAVRNCIHSLNTLLKIDKFTVTFSVKNVRIDIDCADIDNGPIVWAFACPTTEGDAAVFEFALHNKLRDIATVISIYRKQNKLSWLTKQA